MSPKSNPPVHLLPEVLQSWWALWEAFLCKSHFFLAAETSTVLQKVAHELLPVVHVKVAVALQGAAELAARCHGALHSLHEEVTHLGQLSHGFHVSLGEREGGDCRSLQVLSPENNAGSPPTGGYLVVEGGSVLSQPWHQ